MAIRIEWKERTEGLYVDEKKIFERLKELLLAEAAAKDDTDEE